ncbi:MAG: hypothetical protein AUH78_26305 [Gemmatimonadetes bacterium 13_1_40CM_4_69_8]|nr:MAG: hypothetical protein AUH78_26305 [Gemmatimonadetes bacterium 13_1_40CM_4_69_8]OLD32815.1 MAG: hypothetical protein AUI49_02015 [Candidatus Rokubacteria bacterium 13_1_40CM_2_68_13]
MPSASGTIVYAALRTIVAVAVVFAAWHGGRSAWPIIGQAVSDTSCLAFLLAYVDSDLRSSLGWLPLPLLLYVIGWEGWGALRAIDTESDTAADGVGADLLGWLGGLWRWLYRILLVVPPAGAGAFLVFALLYPGAWIFPGMPAPLRCTPETVARGDTLTLRLTGPHGGELGVLTPAGAFLYIVDYAPKTALPADRFEYRNRFSLATDGATGRVLQGAPPGYPAVPIFADTGAYVFRVSEAAEVSASLACRVRFTGERAGP